jgi:predicted nucleic acid-binding protein
VTGPFVVDASVAAKWVRPQSGSEAARRLHGKRLVAPDFLDVECAQVLWQAKRRGLVSAEEALELASLLLAMPVERLSLDGLLPRAFHGALAIEQPIHDGPDLAAAEVTGFALVTADRRPGAVRHPGFRVLALDSLA